MKTSQRIFRQFDVALYCRASGRFLSSSFEAASSISGSVRSSVLSICLIIYCCLGFADPAKAQGTFAPVVMHTGSGSMLLTDTVPYMSNPGLPASSFLHIHFGFATEEQPQPGVFPDSFTISLTGPSGTVYLATADANGISWAPAVPGSLPISESEIQRQPILFEVSTEGLSPIGSYDLGYALPQTWLGIPLTINFDLFDNQNLQKSLGYYGMVPVPEPSCGVLLLSGLVLWYWRRSRVHTR